MNQRHEDLVEEGLDAITSGRIDFDAFVDAHPAEAAELRPILEAAVAVDRAVDVQPRPAFRYVARANFADRIQARSRGSWFSGWTLALRPVAVGAFAVMFATSLAAGGAVAASADATPDNALYGVKIAQESLRLAIARDELDRAGLQARFAERRVDELGRVAQDPSAEQRTYLAQQLATNLQTIARTVQREREQGNISPETRAKLARLAGQLQSSRLSDPELVGRVLAQTPPEHRPLIMRLIRQAQEENQRTRESLEAEAGPHVQTTPEPRSAPGQRIPGAQPTLGQRALDVRPGPGERPPGEVPTGIRGAPGAQLTPGGSSPPGERPGPGARVPGTRPALERTAPLEQPAADVVATTVPPVSDVVMQPAPPPSVPVATDAVPASGQAVPDAPPTPDQMTTGARLSPDETTPRSRSTPSPTPRGTRLLPTLEPRATLIRPTPTVQAPPERLLPALATAPAAR